MGLWHDIKVRLGLEEEWDEEYEDEYYEDDDDDEGESDGFYGRSVYESPHGKDSIGTRRVGRDEDPVRSRGAEHLRAVPDEASRSVGPVVKMHIVEPKSYSEAQGIADKYKQGTPVIMNMTMTQPDLAKRLLDFASGLTYGMNGGLQKISDKVFMLTPENVDVSAGDFRHLQEKGLFGQE